MNKEWTGIDRGAFWMFRRILEKGLNKSCHDPWSELCEVSGFMRKPWDDPWTLATIHVLWLGSLSFRVCV